MNLRSFITIVFTCLCPLLLQSCKDYFVDSSPDDELIDFSYNGPAYPAGFYHEDSAAVSIYYENTISIKPLTQRGNLWIQLSTDNIDTARAWSELSTKYSSNYLNMIGERETEKYYEFKRLFTANPRRILLSRVHKASYLDRSMYNFFKKGNLIGIFKKKFFGTGDVKELIEYLWTIELGDFGKIRSLSFIEDPAGYSYTIFSVEMSHGDFGMSDTIYYYQNTFYVHKNSGEIEFNKKLIKELEGRYHPGNA